LARFDIAGFPNVVAGNNGSFTIVARDTLGHVAANYSGTVYFSSSDVQAGLPASYTFNAADAGVHVFSATLKTAGVQSISAWDYAAGAGGTQTGISVTAAAPSTLSMTGPAAATAGTATSVTVTVRDAYGNLASTYTGTVKITSSDAQAVLPSNYKFAAADNGVHTFGVTLKTATIESITATDANVATMTATVGNIEVAAGAMTGFTLNPSSNPTAGTAMTVKVTAVDAYGNAIKNYAGTVHFSISVANSTIPVDYTFSAVDKGVHTFSLTVNTSGSVTLSVKDTVNPLLGATVTFNVGSGGGGGGGGGGTTSTGGGGTSTGGGGTSTGGGGGGAGKKVVV